MYVCAMVVEKLEVGREGVREVEGPVEGDIQSSLSWINSYLSLNINARERSPDIA